MIKDITEFIFVEHELEAADIIFIPGSCFLEPGVQATKLWSRGYANYVLPSGKYSILTNCFSLPDELSKQSKETYETEWAYMSSILRHEGVSSEAILKEDEARNTFENAFNCRKVTDRLGLNIQKAIVCTQAFHARRCLMYFQWAYPDAKIMICPIETQQINKHNWFKHSNGIERVMGELMRCGTQFVEAIPDYYLQKSCEI